MDWGIPRVPLNPPRFGGVLMKFAGRLGLRILGWNVKGEIPDVPKAVFIGAPHTSNWDFILSMLCIMATGVKVSYLMKKEAFFWPFKSLFVYLGGIPIDRSETSDTVSQLSDWLKTQKKAWVGLTPEGTRSEVVKWKTGFARIAWKAKVPIVLVAWNYPDKTVYIGESWQPSGDFEADVERIKMHTTLRYRGRN